MDNKINTSLNNKNSYNKNKFSSNKHMRNIFIIVGIILGYILVSFLANGDLLTRQFKSLIVPTGINIILAVSLSLTVGFLGELSLGHAGFMSIGAYTSALFTLKMELAGPVEFVIAIILGGLVAGIFGYLIGIPALRLRGDYLAIVTLAFNEIIRSLINSFEFTGGAIGLSKIPRYSNYTWIYVIGVITIVLITNFVNSRYGRAIKSIRDN